MLHHPCRRLVSLLVLSIFMMACAGAPSTGGSPGTTGAGGTGGGVGGSRAVPSGPDVQPGTLWNVYGARPVGFPASGFGPLMNFVGVTGTEAGGAPGHHSVETIPPAKLCQKDLYEAMVAARRARAGRSAQP